MALCDDFKGFHRTILHRSTLPSVDFEVSALLAEEICLTNKGTVPSSITPSVFAGHILVIKIGRLQMLLMVNVISISKRVSERENVLYY